VRSDRVTPASKRRSAPVLVSAIQFLEVRSTTTQNPGRSGCKKRLARVRGLPHAGRRFVVSRRMFPCARPTLVEERLRAHSSRVGPRGRVLRYGGGRTTRYSRGIVPHDQRGAEKYPVDPPLTACRAGNPGGVNQKLLFSQQRAVRACAGRGPRGSGIPSPAETRWRQTDKIQARCTCRASTGSAGPNDCFKWLSSQSDDLCSLGVGLRTREQPSMC